MAMKRMIILVMMAIGLLCWTASSGMAKTTWNANSVWPPNNHHTIGLEEFAANIKQMTGGELEINVSSGGALGYKGPELLKVVRDGLVPISDMLISGVAGEDKVFQIVTLPFLAANLDEAKLLNTIARPYFDKAAERFKQKILYIAPWPGAGLWTQKKLTGIADMKGLKVRTYDKNGALVVEAAGGTPYALPFSEVYSSLASGLIDTVLTSTPTAVDAKFWEVLKFYQPLNVTIATDMVTVNLAAFNKLDKKTQQALIDAGKQQEEKMWKDVKALDQEKEGICNKNGIETVPVSDAFMQDLRKITENIRNDWLKDAPADAKAIYSEFMKQVKR
jgi:TRAP-type C4-dicarboxylate transport system substrate-binding protein